ncbi:MAG: M55 family metallopeptidase [Synergistaceae bacterium]|jgi:D-amino peptidase|nr:M55 family metallopeptidase [Synergistaceae bacterium]
MRIFISADMEGATGIVQWEQVDRPEPDYAFGRKMQLHDVKAVVSGALDAGADEVLVNDSHDYMINLLADELGFDSRVRLLSGSNKKFSMVHGFEGADAAFFVAYHAKAGTKHAILDHTMSSKSIFSVVLNGLEVGETGLNAAACAGEKIPVALVTGDAAVCAEARDLLGEGLVTACVKDAHSRTAANCLLPEESGRVLRKAAALAVERARSGASPIMDIGKGDFDLRVTFQNSFQCDRADKIPGTERMDGRTIRVTGGLMTDVIRWILALI